MFNPLIGSRMTLPGPAPAALVLAASLGFSVITAAPATAASISVSPQSGLDPDGATVDVGGSGFDAAKNNKVGVYVVFGPKRADFHLDAGAFGAAKWVHPGGAGGGQAAMAADGSFSTSLSVKAVYTDGAGAKVDCVKTACYIITMAAHGVPDRSQDTFTRVTFRGGESASKPSASPGPTQSAQVGSAPAASPSTSANSNFAPAPIVTSAAAGPPPSAVPGVPQSNDATAVSAEANFVTGPGAGAAWPFWTAVGAVALLGWVAPRMVRRRGRR